MILKNRLFLILKPYMIILDIDVLKIRRLLNIRYMFEQLDLYLDSKDIGVCWYGMRKN